MVSSLNVVIYRTHDMDLVKRLGSHPDIYAAIGDDGSPHNSADWHPRDSSQKYYLIPWLISLTDDPKPMGCIVFYVINHVLYEGHIFLLPEYQHQISVSIGHKALNWIFNNTPCKKVIAFVPVTMPHLLKLVIKTGFIQEGFLKNSCSSDGKLIDQYIYTIGKDYYGHE